LTLLGVAASLGACSNAADPASTDTRQQSYQPLVLLGDWSSLSREQDPFVEDPAAAPVCTGPGFRIEADYNWLEIDTGLCNWVTLSAVARYAVAEGEMLELTVSHYDLGAAAPASAELRLRFGDCDAWMKTIPIPSAAAVYSERFASSCALPESGNVLFHLNNHGQNTYQLQGLSILR
jgi:hypothetical protein